MTTVQERVQLISDNRNLSINTEYTSAKVELSGICTLNCKFCYNKTMAKRNERQKKMSLFNLCLVIQELKKIETLKEVGLFYMGESGLNSNIIIGYKMLKNAGFFTYLTTNATSIKYIKYAIPYIDSLKISWNYKNLEDFISKTGAKASMYFHIINNVNELYNICHEFGKELTVSTVLDSKKEDYTRALKVLHYDNHYFIPLQSQGGTNSIGFDGVIGESEKPSNPIPCWSLFKGIYIDVDLNVRCCCYGHKEEHIIGNLLYKNLRNILDEIKLADMKQSHLDNKIPEECLDCLRNQIKEC